MFGFLLINEFPLSSPSVETLQRLGYPSTESVTVAGLVYHNPEDFGALCFKLVVRDMPLKDENIGAINIWAADITAITVDVIPSTEAVSALACFNKQLATVDTEVTCVTVTTKAADLSIPYAIPNQLQDVGKQAGRRIADRLKELRTAFKTAKEGNVFTFKFYVREQRDLFNVAIDVNEWKTYLETAKASEAVQSPLAKYFKHSPTAKVFSVGHCPAPGHRDFPANVRGRRLIHFANPDQHILYNVAATYFDAHLQVQAIHDLPSTEFKGYLLPLPHVKGDRQVVCLIDPRGKENLLPKVGETCKILLHELPISDDRLADVTHKIYGAVKKLQGEAEFGTAMKKEVGRYFRDQKVFDSEIQDLLITEDERYDESDSKHHSRVVD